MPRIPLLHLIFACLALSLITGCSSWNNGHLTSNTQTLPPQPSLSTPPAAPSTPSDTIQLRNNACSLLHDLLSDERNLSKLLWIKQASPEVHSLVKKISSSAREAVEKIDTLAKSDPTLSTQATLLPLGEQKARDSISSSHTQSLLTGTHERFELLLLQTQHQAMTYGTHLAKVTASAEPIASNKAYYLQLASTLDDLSREVTTLLLNRISPAPSTVTRN